MCIARDDYFKITFSSFIIFNHMYVYCELEREFSSKMKYFVALKRARDYYFKMTFSSFIIINHMYVYYCELKRVFIENEICGCPEKGK